jgi:hypothetical protein
LIPLRVLFGVEVSMISVVSQQKILESLGKIREHVPSLDPGDKPGQFVLDLARAWKERGGTVAGKPRHSDRYLDDLLRRLGTPVRSLTPKLTGRTQLRPADAGALVHLFLSHWDYMGDPNSSDIGARSADLYTPLLIEPEIEGVCGYIENRILSFGPDSRSDPVEAASVDPEAAQSLLGQDMSEEIARQFQKSVAYFTIGAEQIMLIPSRKSALIGFRNLMQRLWSIDKSDNKKRMLIWSLDLGRQDFDDLESRMRFLNVQDLATRFRALKQFKEADTEERWKWLQSRALIVLHDSRSVRPEVATLPAFFPHHVLFSAIPPKWFGTPNFMALYGPQGERIGELTYTVFVHWSSPDDIPQQTPLHKISSDTNRNYELRYFGHALLRPDDKSERQARSLELIPPGRSYVEALGTVFVAAENILGLRSAPRGLLVDGMKIDPEHALEKLHHYGFRLLRLDEFLQLS